MATDRHSQRSGGSPTLLALVFLTIVGGGTSASEPGKTQVHADIYERAKANFDEAWFLKPVEDKPEELPFKLAPLVLLEGSAGPSLEGGRFHFGTGIGTDPPNPSRPVLYVCPDTVQVRGQVHARMTYLWFCPGRERREGSPGLGTQGVRITLNASGEPAIWEVLTDSSGVDLVYVSETLEAAAAAEFGAPLAGRRFSVEAPLGQAPKTVVARVLDDGPVAMGPMVYLRQAAGDVMTLACRCMNSQAKKLAGMGTYELHPWPHAVARPAGAAFWPADLTERRLDQCLRMPAKF